MLDEPQIAGVKSVRAARDIEDCPAARRPRRVRRGAVGFVCDVDFCAGLYFVDFGWNIIACEERELA